VHRTGEFEDGGVDSRVMVVFDFPFAEEGKAVVAYYMHYIYTYII